MVKIIYKTRYERYKSERRCILCGMSIVEEPGTKVECLKCRKRKRERYQKKKMEMKK